jgi:hypothetical protein
MVKFVRNNSAEEKKAMASLSTRRREACSASPSLRWCVDVHPRMKCQSGECGERW